MSAERLFGVTDKQRRRGSTKALVPVDTTVCPVCSSDLGTTTTHEPALLRHGGYGATMRTSVVHCSNPECRWWMEKERTEVRPPRVQGGGVSVGTLPEHGDIRRYGRGCKCQLCTEANALYHQRRRARLRKENATLYTFGAKIAEPRRPNRGGRKRRATVGKAQVSDLEHEQWRREQIAARIARRQASQ